MAWVSAEPNSVGHVHANATPVDVLTASENIPLNSARFHNSTGAEISVTLAIVRSAVTYTWLTVDVPAGGHVQEVTPDSIQTGDIVRVTGDNGITTWISYLVSVG